MGNVTARYDETDWHRVDGGLRNSSETVDGKLPTSTHKTVVIRPKIPRPAISGRQIPVVGQLVGAAPREYDIVYRSNDADLIYTTKKVNKIEKGFDLFCMKTNTKNTEENGYRYENTAVSNIGNSNLIARVGATYDNKVWHIFQLNKPVFHGQKPETDKHFNRFKKDGEVLYRKASVSFGLNRKRGEEKHTGFVHMIRNEADYNNDDPNEYMLNEPILKIERCHGPRVDTWQFQSMNPSMVPTSKTISDYDYSTKNERLSNVAIERNGKDRNKPLPSLTAYWKWTTKLEVPMALDDNMVLDIAKGSDLSLHVILAVLTTIEHKSIKANFL